MNEYEVLELSGDPNAMGAWLDGQDKDNAVNSLSVMDGLGLLDGPTPSAQMRLAQATKVLAKHGLQRRPRVYWDSEPIPVAPATTQLLQLFQSNAGKTAKECSMRGQNGLPSPQRLFCRSIHAKFVPDVPATVPYANMSAIMGGTFRLSIADKLEFETPDLNWLPWPGDVGVVADNSAAAFQHAFQLNNGQLLQFSQPFVFRPTVNFMVEIQFDPVVSPAAAGRIYIAMSGPGWRAI